MAKDLNAKTEISGIHQSLINQTSETCREGGYSGTNRKEKAFKGAIHLKIKYKDTVYNKTAK